MKEELMMPLRTALIPIVCLSLVLCASSPQKTERARQKDPQYQYNVGLFHLNNNDLDEAVKYLNRCLALNPRFHLAWNAMGLAHSMKGDFERSIKDFQKALEINPRFTEARNNLGTIYQEMGRLDEAETEFRKAILDSAYESRELPFYNLARLHFTREQYDQAFENIQSALQIQPRFALAHNLKGLILEKRNNLSEAIASYEQAVKIVPDDLMFNLNLGEAYFNNRRWEKAREVFEKIISRVTDLETQEKLSAYLKAIRERRD
jgi:Tfp pilus assembly protein PilF